MGVPPRPVRNPPNPWLSSDVEWLEVYQDATREILSSNDSPDIPFSWSVNPYRGCAHGCAYCYARPTHEHLGFGAGTDFDTRITVKPRAAELLRAAWLLLKLPGSTRAVFEERLREALPERAERVLHRVRETRGGALDDRRFGVRMRGTGPYAQAIDDLFAAAARRLGLEGGRGGEEPATTFRRPPRGQLPLL